MLYVFKTKRVRDNREKKTVLNPGKGSQKATWPLGQVENQAKAPET